MMNNYPSRYFKYRDINICDRPPYVLKRIDDISSGTATRQEQTYYGFDGCKYSNILYERRAFQVTGTIITNNYFDFVQARRKLIAAASMKEEADAEYFNRKDSYYAKCYFLSLPTFGDRLAWTCEFTLEFSIPSFYWLSLKKSTVLPHSSFTSVRVENCGDVETYPVYLCTKQDGQTPSTPISIETNTNQIVIDYEIQSGDTVYVDTFNSDVYKISNGVKTSLLSSVRLQSDFFPIPVGQNNIYVTSTGMDVICQHYDRFLGV